MDEIIRNKESLERGDTSGASQNGVPINDRRFSDPDLSLADTPKSPNFTCPYLQTIIKPKKVIISATSK